jgi:sugar phosphate isomerase/epimerase
MKLGFIGFIYTPPDEITEPLAQLEWQITRAAELGCSVFHPTVAIPRDKASLGRLKDLLARTHVELEIPAPRETFALDGPDAKSARAAVESAIDLAKTLGSTIMRNGYGKLNVETSRFNRKRPIKEHLAFLVRNLKAAAAICESHGVSYALENHCDFNGREFAEVFDAVGSRFVGSALDTGNGYTVYWDPNDDVEALAQYAITTHIKDMKVIDYASDLGLIPYQARGCAVGDGNVDIPRVIDLLEQRAPHAEGLHLVVEQGWLDYAPGIDPKVQDKQAVEKGLAYLRTLIQPRGGSKS